MWLGLREFSSWICAILQSGEDCEGLNYWVDAVREAVGKPFPSHQEHLINNKGDDKPPKDQANMGHELTSSLVF